MKIKFVFKTQIHEEIKSPLTRIIIYNMNNVEKVCIGLLKSNIPFHCYPDTNRATIDILDFIDEYDIQIIIKQGVEF